MVHAPDDDDDDDNKVPAKGSNEDVNGSVSLTTPGTVYLMSTIWF